jgi:hypothetical protein
LKSEDVVKGVASKAMFDPRSMTRLMIRTVKTTEEFYGPFFSKMVAKAAAEFEAKRIGDQNPPRIETMEEAAEYIMQNIGKYPDGFCPVIYGLAKAENTLQGGIGPGGRTTAKKSALNLLMGSYARNSTNSTEVYRMQTSMAKEAGLLVGDVKEVSGDENSVTVLFEGCHFADACKAIAEEKIGKVAGGFECTMARSGAASLEYSTKLTHDFEVTRFTPPNCIFRMFKV